MHSVRMADRGVSSIEVTTVKLEVPAQGIIDGLCFDGQTCQYLGIPYAEIPGRFRRPKPATSPWPNNAFDGTKFGPYHPQPPRDFYPVPVPSRPWANTPAASEFDCLNLNVSVPFRPHAHSELLPVMLFLHGGAFTYATGSAGIYDGRVLADVSRENGSPTIVISINYRLGVFGFLASREILEYNARFGEEGVGNYGIWDQVEALRWVQRNITAFGGDPTRVTLFGQSAGGVSTNAHLLRNEPLFSSAILQSGLLPLCGIMSVDQYQIIYEKTLDALSIPNDLSSEERFQALLDIDESRLTASMVDVFMTPVITLGLCDDHVLCKSPMPSWSNFDTFVAPDWCKRIMIGDAKNECIIWNKAYKHLDFNGYLEQGARLLGRETVLKLFEIYGIKADMIADELFWAAEQFTTDGMYLAPNFDAMRAYPSCYAYHFDEPSPFDNEWGGLAHHSLDNVFIWNVLRHTLPLSQQRQSKRMAQFWLSFANGEAPWEEFGSEAKMMVFADGEACLRTPEMDQERGYGRWKRIRELGLAEDFGKLCDDICIRRRDILDPSVEPKAMEASITSTPLAVKSTTGVVNVL